MPRLVSSSVARVPPRPAIVGSLPVVPRLPGRLGFVTDWVLHVDLDQFIAAVEVLRHPELAGLPVVVGGDGDPSKRGVVATASYEAREYGIRSGMALRTAYRRCPQAVFLAVDRDLDLSASARA